MSKIYIPSDYVNSPCKVVNNNYIRAYTDNNLTHYVDIYINQDYMLKEGYSTYGYNGQCDSLNSYTDNYYYRLDLPNILIGFSIFAFFGIFIPVKIFSKIFKKGGL